MRAKKSAAAQAIGEAIRSLRRERGLAQDALAARAGLDRSYCRAIERGEFNLTLDTLVKAATALGVRPSAPLRRARL